MRGAVAIALGSALALAAPPASAQDLSPQELFRRVAPSVVVVEVTDSPKKGQPKLIASGSGVVVPDRAKDEMLIATNCHVVDQAGHGFITIRQGDEYGLGWTEARDPERDLCLVRAVVYDEAKSTEDRLAYKKLPAAQIGSSQWLEVGDPVYAVGAPQGLELSLSNGLVSGFRGYKGSEYIQTTAPISKGSSGGGLFDAQGRLVGITTMYVKDAQALNFAVPAELIASVPKYQPQSKMQSTNQKSTSEHDSANDQNRWREIFYSKSSNEKYYMDMNSRISSGSSISAWIKSTSGYWAAWVIDGKEIPYHEQYRRITFFCDTWEILVSESYITNRDGIHLGRRGRVGPFTVSPTSGYDPIISVACSP